MQKIFLALIFTGLWCSAAWAEYRGIPPAAPQPALEAGTDYLAPTGSGSALTHACTTSQSLWGGGAGSAETCQDSTGTGSVVRSLGPTIVTPTISGTGMTNMQHAHAGATSGGQLVGTAAITGTAWRGGYFNGSGAFTEYALGASGTVLVGNGVSAAPGYSATPTITTLTATTVNATTVAAGSLNVDPQTVPAFTGYDSDAAGTTLAYRWAFAWAGSMTTTTQGAETSDTWGMFKNAGTQYVHTYVDGSAWELTWGVSDATGATVAGKESEKCNYDTTDNQITCSSVSGVTRKVYTGIQLISATPILIPFTIPAPATTGTMKWTFKARQAMTITGIDCICDPADADDTVTIDINECDSTADNCATVDAAIACDNDGAADDGTLSNASIDAGDWISLDVDSGDATATMCSGVIYATFN